MQPQTLAPALDLDGAMAQLPLVAILRGVRPEEVLAIAEVLFDAGWRMVEVPLNSPQPLESIALLARHYGERMLVGAGTVLDVRQVHEVAAAGGRLIVSPNMDPEVIAASKRLGLYALPGVQTASECFAALRAGADALKLFPGEAISPAIIKALRAVLPASSRLLPVGGITPDNMAAFSSAGASGFGIGSALFKPGMHIDSVRQQAQRFALQLAESRQSAPPAREHYTSG
ncbi:2-dehydro-3-deoxy-6-phosphogalactonate aldolase [Vogesella oryzae]|uniref:2-dehydro-3-deoxy-6-phosphogalactonate aldolase n=1 Tax=Vogesella oryzae TaxID=1735285 RepID=UPI00158406D4|nr:2-dehydro-3-deoxy-6-phosphogalactonate aldolase [Vogesella oryzae]